MRSVGRMRRDGFFVKIFAFGDKVRQSNTYSRPNDKFGSKRTLTQDFKLQKIIINTLKLQIYKNDHVTMKIGRVRVVQSWDERTSSGHADSQPSTSIRHTKVGQLCAQLFDRHVSGQQQLLPVASVNRPLNSI